MRRFQDVKYYVWLSPVVQFRHARRRGEKSSSCASYRQSCSNFRPKWGTPSWKKCVSVNVFSLQRHFMCVLSCALWRQKRVETKCHWCRNLLVFVLNSELTIDPAQRCCSSCFNRVARLIGNNPQTNEPLVSFISDSSEGMLAEASIWSWTKMSLTCRLNWSVTIISSFSFPSFSCFYSIHFSFNF